MREVLVVHYSEIGTKGGNRRVFEAKLADDIRRRLGPQVLKVRIESARVLADLAPTADREKISLALEPVFGVAWYAFGVAFPWTAEDPGWAGLESAALAEVKRHPSATTFKVFARRSEKNYPLSSQDICRRLGEKVIQGAGLRVDLDHHDLAIHVEVVRKEIFLFAGRSEGLRGMPQSSSGRLLCLFSGGIDSPVAAWLMLRRGARVDLLHFHPYRSSEEVVGTKITGLFDALKIFNPGIRLYLVPHDRYQVAASLRVPTSYETVFFRRFMFRAGEILAQRLNYQGLLTGDSLGQVASQTLENLAAVQTGLSVPVFQPLISYDKESIVRLAQKINAYELAIQPYKDCCSLMAKKPKTNADVSIVRRLETELEMDQMIDDSLDAASLWDGHGLQPVPPKARSKATPPSPSPC